MSKKQEVIDYWLKSAERDRETAKILFDNKKYDQCLFFSHLFLEKVLKGAYIKKRNKYPPLIHKLEKLAKKAGIKLDQQKQEQLAEITKFNIQARYDDYKFNFYKKATKEFAQKYSKICNSLYQWLLKQI